MNFRHELNEYIQGNIGESVKFRLEVETRQDRFVVKLILGQAMFSIRAVKNSVEGKELATSEALNELRYLTSEVEIRQRLGLSPV